jgi:hypothetical protein
MHKQNAKRAGPRAAWPILHSAFCILHPGNTE